MPHISPEDDVVTYVKDVINFAYSDIRHDDKDRLHCIDGPAFNAKFNNGYYLYWYVKGIECANWQEFQHAAKLSSEDILVLRLKYPDFDCHRV